MKSILIHDKNRCCNDRLNPPCLFDGGITVRLRAFDSLSEQRIQVRQNFVKVGQPTI